VDSLAEDRTFVFFAVTYWRPAPEATPLREMPVGSWQELLTNVLSTHCSVIAGKRARIRHPVSQVGDRWRLLGSVVELWSADYDLDEATARPTHELSAGDRVTAICPEPTHVAGATS
jgi:hypothetical protein